MKRKVPKSLQAILITLLVGMFLPKAIEITGISLADKLIMRSILTLAFNLATIIVGVMYATNLIQSKKEGGKARITIYLVLIVILLCAVTSVLAFIKETGKTLLIILSSLSLLMVGLLIFRLILTLHKNKEEFRVSQKESVNNKTTRYARNANSSNKVDSPRLHSPQNNHIPQQPVDVVESQVQVSDSSESTLDEESAATGLKTIYQLWDERDPAEKCLTVTNDENPNLRWVKIYAPPNYEGKFRGYIKMMNARDTVKGEIWYADKPIWVLYDE